MVFNFFLSIIYLLFITTQVFSKGKEAILEDVKEQLEKGNTGEYQKDRNETSRSKKFSNKSKKFYNITEYQKDKDGASSSQNAKQWQYDYNNEGVASSLNNMDDFSQGEGFFDSLLAQSSINEPFLKYTAENFSNWNQHCNLSLFNEPFFKNNIEQLSYFNQNCKPSPINESYLKNNAEQLSNLNQYFELDPVFKKEEHDEEYLKNFVDSFLEFPDNEEELQEVRDDQEVANVNGEPLTNPASLLTLSDFTTPTMASGPHKFTYVIGKWNDVRKNCKDHYRNHKSLKKVITKCESCDEMLCAVCHAIKHGLPSLPPDPRPQPQPHLEYQTCIFCNTNISNRASWLVDHSYRCQKKPKVRGVYFCCLCYKEERFQLSNLAKHVRSQHTGEKPCVCEICGKGYGDTSNLKSHIKRNHIKKSV